MFFSAALVAGLEPLASACAILVPPSCGGFLPFILCCGCGCSVGSPSPVGWRPGTARLASDCFPHCQGVPTLWDQGVSFVPYPPALPLLLTPLPASAWPRGTGGRFTLTLGFKAPFRVWGKSEK